MSWALQAVLAAGLFLAGGAAGVKWHAGVDAQKAIVEKAARAEVERNDRRAADAAAAGHEADKVQIRTVYVKVKQEVARVAQTPFYAADQLCLDDAGLRAVAGAGRAAPAVGSAAAAVP